MSRPIRLHEDADRELSDAAEYSHLERPGLGAVFMESAEEGCARIRCSPEAASDVPRGVTGLTPRSFPYTVIYEVRDDLIRARATSSCPVVGFDVAAVYCRGSAPPATGDT